MKLIFSSLFLLLQITLFSQNWFQDDDRWSYKIGHTFGAGFEGIQEVSVDRDTLLLGKNAKILRIHNIGSDGQEYLGETIVYQEDQKIYTIDNQNIEMQYDFSLVPGATFSYPFYSEECTSGDIKYHLDSISYLVLETDSLKIQNYTVTHPFLNAPFCSKIIERVGSFGFFRLRSNYTNYCIQNYSYSDLISFKDFEIFKSYIDDPCNEIISSVEENLNEFKIFPNPASDIIFIESIDDIQSIMVKNINGQYLMQSSKSNQIDIGGLPNGIYFLLVSSDSQNSTFKIVKH